MKIPTHCLQGNVNSMRSSVSVILSTPAPETTMSHPDYEQTSHDHSSLLILVKSIGKWFYLVPVSSTAGAFKSFGSSQKLEDISNGLAVLGERYRGLLRWFEL